jgi:hypothetical protein
MVIVRHAKTSCRASKTMSANSIATCACNCTGHVSWLDVTDTGGSRDVGAAHWLQACIHARMPRRMNRAKP